jgi:hypothetical protein
VAEEEMQAQINQKMIEFEAQRKELKEKLPKTSVGEAGQVKEDPETQKIRAEIEQLNKDEASEIAKIQADARQKITSYDYEANKIIKELLKKKPSEMTQEEFQTYLLIEQKNVTEQHLENVRKWQTFDVLFRTIPYATGTILTIIILAAD